MFLCTVCSSSYANKQNYEKHLKSKKHLKQITIKDEYSCSCGKIFSCRQSLHVHKKKCVINYEESTIEFYKNKLKKEKEETESLRRKIEELLVSNVTNIGTQNNTQNNITININAFGKENIDYLDDNKIIECLDRVYKSIPAIIEKIHFDPEHPENHNIKITNKKLPYATVMGDNSEWKTVDRKDAIESMVSHGYNILDEKYPDNKKYLSTNRQSNFEIFQDKFDNEDKDLLKQVKTDVELTVLNGKV